MHQRADFTSPADFAGRTVLVCGARVAGLSAARALSGLGATVLVTDNGPSSLAASVQAPATFVGDLTALPSVIDAVVTSPGIRPQNPLLVAAAQRRIPILGELEFAWRIRGNTPATWLMVTGTNGKTTTVRMLESMLTAAGLRALAVGNVGEPIIDAVSAEEPYDVLAVEASSFQLHHSSTIAPRAGVLLNLAADHLDWHGSMDAYAAVKTRVWGGDIAIGNADDPAVAALLAASANGHKQEFTLTEPRTGQWGCLAGDLCAMLPSGVQPIMPQSEIRPPGRHNVANALAAAALAHTVGVTFQQIAAGLRSFVADPHRNEFVARLDGVDYIDDSKATNAHAAAASLAAYPSVIWIGGGQLKGAPIADLVAEFAPRMRGAVVLGADRDLIAAAFARHAPDLPLIMVSRTDDGAMRDVVAAAASLARAGDAVLLAPAAASLDMYTSYSARGAAFAAAVTALSASRSRAAGHG
jgi:UDP-N-acetylmuramoylalanine--D-glutamate ligase